MPPGLPHSSMASSSLHTSYPGQSFTRPGPDTSSFSTSFSQAPLHHQNPYGYASHASQESTARGPSSSFRSSFSEVDNRKPVLEYENQVIYTASYSGVPVYEMEVNKVAVMRRRVDSWLNATQILKVAGIEKGRRTKILEKEILTGQHEKVQGGYGRYQGTWISYSRGREFCRQYQVEDMLRPLLDYDINHDGTGNTAHADTPTKEQAMAANRKKFFSSSVDNRINGQNGNTFFQNLSPTASTALNAMKGAARYDTAPTRPGSAQKRPANTLKRQSSQTQGPQDGSFVNGSMRSFTSDRQNQDSQESTFTRNGDKEVEPPRKKTRTSIGQDPYVDDSMMDETQTEPNESFSQHGQNFARDSDQGPVALPTLPNPEDAAEEERRRVLLNMLSDASRTDPVSHAAIANYSSEDLDIPLDARGNTALHWAALLGKINIMRELIRKGANIFRGNAGGETALMHAVSVNNTYEQNCFRDMLEHLGPLIEIRDAIGRTVLHHIAVASGIKGRTPSSRYYLRGLLEFIVLQGSASNSQTNPAEFFPHHSSETKTITLARFMAEVVNVQDKCGNTALNLVSRIGSHMIINQLEEVNADFSIPNHKGFRPESFGIFPRGQIGGSQQTGSSGPSQSTINEAKPSHIDKIREEIFATTQSILAQTQSHYTTELNRLSTLHDQQTANLRQFATEHSSLVTTLETLQSRARERKQRAMRLQKLRCVRDALRNKQASSVKRSLEDMDLALDMKVQVDDEASLPSVELLAQLVHAHEQNNETLKAKIKGLKSEQASSDELEATYRKVVSMCSGVPEEEVEAKLMQLLEVVEADAEVRMQR